MELKLLFILLRRWIWLLLIGLILGAGAGFFISTRQTPVYQATTKVMVIQPQESSVTADVSLSDQELAQTYIALLTTQPVLDAASERLGFAVHGGQVSAQQTSGTRLLEVVVRAGNADQAALIANTLVDVLIERNNTLQSGRFSASEESLQAQISQVENQINQLRNELNGENSEDSQDRRQTLETDMANLRKEINVLHQEIDNLTSPSLSNEEENTLLNKQVELAQMQFDLTVEQNAYSGRLQQNPNTRDTATEQRILDLQEGAILLQQEIDDLRTNALANTPEALDQLAEKQATLEQLQLQLDVAEGQYMNLLAPGQSTSSGGNTGTQERQQTSLSLYQQLYSNLLSTYESVRLARLQNTPDLVQVEQASAPNSAIEPRPLQSTLLGGAIGLLIMGAIAFLIEYLDDSIKTPEEISQAFGLPVIGYIADTGSNGNGHESIAVAEEPRSPTAEAFRALRTNLDFANVDKSLKTILITSPNPTDGKTTVAVNLAAIMVQGGNRVLLIDADLRRPRIHRFFDISNKVGLSDVFLWSEAKVTHVVKAWQPMKNLRIIPSGNQPPNPTELLDSARMDEILAQAKELGDMVIIDSPPFVVSDAAVLAAKVDGVLLILRPGQTSIGAAQAMVEQLRRANARIIGVVLNRIPNKGGLFSNGYGYYYAPYYYDSSKYYHDQSNSNGHGPKRKKSGRLRLLGKGQHKTKTEKAE
ncbi:MAG: polysaccharide biosynthesis tyrosine autokinase [Candidatus Promineifilaceae bacterium]